MSVGADLRASILGSLKSYWQNASVEVATATVSGLRGSMDTYGRIIQRLEPAGDLGTAALTSTASHDHWVRVAKDCWAGVTNVLQNLGRSTSTWNNYWSEVKVSVSTGAEAVKSAAAQVADSIPSKTEFYIVLGAVVLIVVALAVVKVG